MLHIHHKAHRMALRAGTYESQKLFSMLRLLPDADIAKTRPPLALALLIDTSGSMNGPKLARARDAAHRLLDDQRLRPDDLLAVLHFDAEAHVLLSLGPLSRRADAEGAIDSLNAGSGATNIAQGLRLAAEELSHAPRGIPRRLVLLSDGKATDESDCRSLLVKGLGTEAPVLALGIGDGYNEGLLLALASVTQGRPYHLQQPEQLRGILDTEVGSLVREVITDLRMTVLPSPGTTLDRAGRLYPSLAEVRLDAQPFALGSVGAGDYTIFVMEWTISGMDRPPGPARLAEISLTAWAPSLDKLLELPALDFSVTFSTDEAAIAAVDAEVLGYIQQRNVDRLVQDAVHQSTLDPSRARRTLESAVALTQQVGNAPLARMLQGAVDELGRTGKLTSGTIKTVALGGRTRTIKTAAVDPLSELPSEDEIRRITGT